MKRIVPAALLAGLLFLSGCDVASVLHDGDYVMADASEISRATDGRWTGEVDYRLDKAAVAVTVEEGRITDVEIVSVLAWDWRDQAVREAVPGRIVAAGGLEIDAVTGATGSTHAIRIAVSEAIRGAGR